MTRFFLLSLLLALSILPARAAEAPAEEQALFSQLLEGLIKNDVTKVAEKGDDAFKAAMTSETLAQAHSALEPRLSAGYEAQYLGVLTRQSHTTHLWKLTFKDGGDDLLCIVSLKSGQVSGFVLQ